MTERLMGARDGAVREGTADEEWAALWMDEPILKLVVVVVQICNIKFTKFHTLTP